MVELRRGAFSHQSSPEVESCRRVAAGVNQVGWPPQKDKHGKAALAAGPGFFSFGATGWEKGLGTR
jgi:hypothetical protein